VVSSGDTGGGDRGNLRETSASGFDAANASESSAWSIVLKGSYTLKKIMLSFSPERTDAKGCMKPMKKSVPFLYSYKI
jgi:hypothetical protein